MPYIDRTYPEDKVHSKKCGLFQPKFGSIMDKPKCWFKKVIKKCTVKSESWVKILNFIFNPTFGFVHILSNFVLKKIK